jgi:two-component system, OmpR family, sensor histidine kinase PhoQ
MARAKDAEPSSSAVGRVRFDGWRPRSLRARQLLAASIGLLAFLALAGYALDSAFVATAEDNLRQRLKAYALKYVDGIEFTRNGLLVPPYDPPDPRLDMPDSGLYAQVVMPDSTWGSNSTLGPQLPQSPMLGPLEEVFDAVEFRRADGSQNRAYRYGVGFVYAELGPDEEFPYTIYVLEDAMSLTSQIRVFRGALWVYLGSAGVFLLLLQMLVLRWSLRPLKRVIAELTRVQAGEAPGMSTSHPVELQPLTDSINAFIDSERENLDRQRNTLADLAHSLKTPLAVLRTQMDSGADDAALRQELDAQLKRMNGLVSYQLARAASSGHKLFSAPVAIEPHAEEIVRGLEKVYAAKGVLCEFEIDPAARFYGEPGDLLELLGNLLENAFKWARSRVLLTVVPGRLIANRRAGLLLSVEDDGPGIAEEDVVHILQRGVRGDERVQGHGIGLATVQDLVREYRGELQVKRSQELGGAHFQVVLPPGL